MFEDYFAVIMAGGGGTRLWPLSRQAKPKQMLALFDERTMFQASVQRLVGLFPPERIYVVTVEEQIKELQAQCPEIPLGNFIPEPMPRGTASVVGLAAIILQKINPHSVMAVIGSDYFIRYEERFRRLLSSAYQAAKEGYLVTLGIEPTYPSTGLGYIHKGEMIGEFGGVQLNRVGRFHEKPGEDQARAMLASGEYAWNSGMFIWKVDQILAEIERQMPDLARCLHSIAADWGKPDSQNILAEVWPGLKNISVDYGIMENARDIAVLSGVDIDWSDVGSWDSLFDLLPRDQYGNTLLKGRHYGLDTTGSLIYTGQPDRLIVTIGVEDMVVVEAGNVILVCKKDQAQRVRQVVAHLRQNEPEYI